MAAHPLNPDDYELGQAVTVTGVLTRDGVKGMAAWLKRLEKEVVAPLETRTRGDGEDGDGA